MYSMISFPNRASRIEYRPTDTSTHHGIVDTTIGIAPDLPVRAPTNGPTVGGL
jgi:hypothetical protein